MVKIVAFVRHRADWSFDQFARHWIEQHSEIVRGLPGLRGYVQNPAVQIEGRDWPYDGMAELWFDDLNAVREAFRGPEADAVRADEDRFVGELVWFIADEKPVIGPPARDA